jgi:hypothetical protein
MRFLLYFFMFYFMIRLVRRLIYGPKPKRRFYVNFGTNQSKNPYDRQKSDDEFRRSTNEGEPHVGSFNNKNKSQSSKSALQNIQDADFEEINSKS